MRRLQLSRILGASFAVLLLFELPLYLLTLDAFEFAKSYPNEFILLVWGLASIIVSHLLPISFDDYGIKIVHFNWSSVILVTIGISIFPFLAFLITFLANELPWSNWMSMSSTAVFIVYLVFAPVVEEFLFRGLIQTILKPLESFRKTFKGLDVSLSVVITAALFTAIHITHSIPALLFIFMLGLQCSYLREKYKSIVPAILAHSTFNMLAVFIPRVILNID